MPLRSPILAAAFVLGLGLLFGTITCADEPKAPTEYPKPPPGWKEHSPADGSFMVWVPEKSNRRSERSSSRTVNGLQIKINTLFMLNTGGPNYVVEEGILSANIANKLNRADLENAFRDEAAKVIGGRVVEEKDATVPGLGGKEVAGKEYRIESKSIARVRIFVTPNRARLFILRIEGSKDQVDGENAKVFLESGRLTPTKNPAAGGRILGGGNDPQFKDVAPEGGLLVGLEVGLGKFVANDIVKAIRPIYRVGEKETLGAQFGAPGENVVKVVARPGYAVGAISIRYALAPDGFSIRFMKVVGGKLDPKDSYESEWVGGMGGGNPVKLGGTGTPVIGVIGRSNPGSKDVTGLGILFKEPEKK